MCERCQIMAMKSTNNCFDIHGFIIFHQKQQHYDTIVSFHEIDIFSFLL